jgi:hypothetical protein
MFQKFFDKNIDKVKLKNNKLLSQKTLDMLNFYKLNTQEYTKKQNQITNFANNFDIKNITPLELEFYEK